MHTCIHIYLNYEAINTFTLTSILQQSRIYIILTQMLVSTVYVVHILLVSTIAHILTIARVTC